MNKKPCSLWLPLVVASIAWSASADDVYRVTSETRLENPQRFGANFELKSFSPWSELHRNCWNKFSSAEPIVFRHNGQATDGGADFIEAKSGAPVSAGDFPTSPGSGFWSTMGNGFWNGAEVRIYRPTEHSITLIRKSRVKQFNGLKDTDQRMTLEDEGEPIHRGDLFVLTMIRGDVPDALNPERKQHYNQQMYGNLPSPGSGVTWSIDTSTRAPEGGSTASMKIVIPKASSTPIGIEQPFLRFEGRELGLESGKTYQCSVWLRQEGLAGPVTLQVGDRVTKQIDVGPEWQKVSFDVPNTSPIGPKTYSLLLGAVTPGTLWMDNLLIAQDDVEPFAVMPKWIEILREFQPGVLRSMSGRYLLTLDAWLSEGYTRKQVWQPDPGPQSPGDFSLREQLELCKATGARPWLMTYAIPDDEELDGLMEYLGAPADVGYGKLRAEHGQVQPWTEVFDAIYIECANEMWNGRFFAPQAFEGQPELVGKVANRVLERVKNSPYNTRRNIRGVGPAWAHNLYEKGRGWTFKVSGICTEMDVVGAAPSGYIGGYDGESIVGVKDDDLFQANLFYSAQVMEPKLAELDEIRRLFRENQGRDLEMLKYEAGPGYAIPNPDRPFIEEAELVGKSLALGIATLDNFLFVMANNGNANYFTARVGPNWSSHNLRFEPHTTWLAMSLRNQYCQGRLLKVVAESVETIDLPARRSVGLGNNGKPSDKTIEGRADVPITQLYAFADGDRYSYIALNRSFSQSKTIRIHVPYKPSSTLKTYGLTHPDPRITNRDAYNVRIRETIVTNFHDGYAVVLPPSSAVVMINEKTTDSGESAEP